MIRAHASDDAPAFSSASFDLSSRATTTAAAVWAPPAWATVGDAGLDQRSVDLAPVLQEIVDRPGWAAGQALVLLISGSGERVADAYDGSPSGAPLLHVEYTTP